MMKSAQAGDAQGSNQRVGQVIKGKWKIESLLGVGGMASVYAASHRNSQRAALKILHADFAREKTICERFLREAYVSNKVNHAATVQVLDDDVTEQGEPFLIMELLEGETVRDAWKKAGRTMPVPQVLQICERVLDCLISCHAISVIHRDLKPANIFITNEGEIKVLDFGVAQMRDATAERTATGTALGTPAYMSPEQAMGLVDQLDGRADLFSVGAMMHALITGHRINNGRTEQEALVMAATKPVPSVARIAPNLPIEVIQIVDKSLAWDRRNRYADAREMQNAVIEAMTKLGAQPLTSGRAPRPNQVVVPQPPPVATQGPAVAPPAPQPAPPIGVPPLPPPLPVAPPPAPAPQPAPVAQPAPPPTPAAPEVPENDPRVIGLRDMMKHFDRVLPSVRQLGWKHPATERTVRTAYEACAEALRQRPDLVDFTIRPYSFMTLGHAVWEPGPPFDSIPYNLFACGIRTLRLAAGITYEEYRELLTLFMLDPGRDLPPEDDLASALWERGMPHVSYDTVDAFAEGDATEREAFYAEADAAQAQAEEAAKNHVSRVEARAMAVSTDRRALSAVKAPSPLSLDDVVKNVILSQFEMNRDKWTERYVDALVEGLLDAAANRDAPLVLASLRKSAADLVVAGRSDAVGRLHQALIEKMGQRVQNQEHLVRLIAGLSNAMFGGETLEIALRRAREDASQVEALPYILSHLGGAELPQVLASLREGGGPQLRALLLQFAERTAIGREAEIVAAAQGTDPDVGAALLRLLAQAPGGRQALAQLSQAEDVNVRLEARILLSGSPEQALSELVAMLENPQALLRIAALRTVTRHTIRGAWPTIARLVNAKNFNELGSDERRELLRALVMLSPERGEPVALDIAKKGGVLVSEEREVTRTIAADVLGDISRSVGAASALAELAQSRWGVSDETRAAASAASKKIMARLEGGHP
ncbi:MAG: serine/threonine protein kinase [Myxococcales bacterium]|nr:serine/threonine protein kinase [Myxococcales bacterium]